LAPPPGGGGDYTPKAPPFPQKGEGAGG